MRGVRHRSHIQDTVDELVATAALGHRVEIIDGEGNRWWMHEDHPTRRP
jgi:hypothetical protein